MYGITTVPNEGKPDLYLMCASLEQGLIIGAFLVTSDRLNVVMEGIKMVSKLYEEQGATLFGEKGFRISMSDNQSGLQGGDQGK